VEAIDRRHVADQSCKRLEKLGAMLKWVVSSRDLQADDDVSPWSGDVARQRSASSVSLNVDHDVVADRALLDATRWSASQPDLVALSVSDE